MSDIEVVELEMLRVKVSELEQKQTQFDQLQADLAAQLGDMTRLHQVLVRLSYSFELKSILEEVLYTVTQLQTCKMSILRLYDAHKETLHTTASIGCSPEYIKQTKHIRLGEGIAGKAILEQHRVIIADVGQEPFLEADARLGGYQALHSTPLLTHTGKIIGTIDSYFENPYQPSERELRLVDLYAYQAAELIDNAQLYQEIQEAKKQATFLSQVGNLLAASLDYEATLGVIVRLAVPTLGDICELSFFDKNENCFYRVAIAHADPTKEKILANLSQKYQFDPQMPNLFVQALEEGHGLLLPEISEQMLDRLSNDAYVVQQVKQTGPYLTGMIVPLIARERKIGVLAFATTTLSNRLYTAKDLALAEEVAHRAALAIDNVQLYDEAKQVIEMQHELEHFKDLLVSMATHEFRTPLTSIKGYAQILQRQLEKQVGLECDQAGHKDFALHHLRNTGIILQNSDRINNLVDQLLDFTRLQDDSFELNITNNVPLVALLEGIISQEQAKNKQTNIIFKTNDIDVMTNLDKVRIEQVLITLISNARKYGSPDTPISIGVKKQADEVIVWVQDHGAGIGKTHHDHIFERFYQVRTRKEFPMRDGLGLGLYLSYEAINRHGGRMWLESEPNVGSVFYFSLPLIAN